MPSQRVPHTLAGQYPVQYGQPAKVPSVPQAQSLSQSHFSGQPVLFTARDWQQSVASVFDPNGLKRRWNYSVDHAAEHSSKRQR